MLDRIERRAHRFALTLALAGAACLLAVALATTLDILLRWLFKAPIPGLMDIAALATAIVVAACFPMLIVNRGNVTMRLFGLALGGRAARVLDAFGALVTAAFFAMMGWQYVRFSLEATRAGESTPILRWPVAPWWWVVTALITVAALAAVVVFLRELRGPRIGDAPHDVNI